MMSSVERLVLYCNVLSFINLFRICSHALSTGIAVNKETTSNDAIISSSSMVVLAISLSNSVELETEKPLLF